jgi:hypothetical protein
MRFRDLTGFLGDLMGFLGKGFKLKCLDFFTFGKIIFQHKFLCVIYFCIFKKVLFFEKRIFLDFQGFYNFLKKFKL